MKYRKPQESRVGIVERKEGYPKELFTKKSLRRIPYEKEMALSGMNEKNREDSATAWLLAMHMLGDVHVAFGEHGKPYLTDQPDVYFSLTHAKSGLACIVSGRECGIDLEDTIQYKERLARRICTKEELEMLEESSEKDRLLTRMWTIKEAYVKMLGIGLSYGMNNVNTCAMKEDVHVMQKDDYCLAVVERKGNNHEDLEPTTKYISCTELL